MACRHQWVGLANRFPDIAGLQETKTHHDTVDRAGARLLSSRATCKLRTLKDFYAWFRTIGKCCVASVPLTRSVVCTPHHLRWLLLAASAWEVRTTRDQPVGLWGGSMTYQVAAKNVVRTVSLGAVSYLALSLGLASGQQAFAQNLPPVTVDAPSKPKARQTVGGRKHPPRARSGVSLRRRLAEWSLFHM